MSTRTSWGLKGKKSVQALVLCGGGGGGGCGKAFSTTKIGLSSPVSLIVSPENAEFVVLMQFLVIFFKMSQPFPRSQYQMGNPGPGTTLDTVGLSLKYLEKQTVEDTMKY